MNAYKVITKRRSIRRFKQKRIPYKKIQMLVDAARLAPSAANLQPLEFIVVDRKEIVDRIFPHLRWAGYLKEKGPPEESSRPVAYIIVLINRQRCKFPQYAQADLGAAIENILLAATDAGLACCWIGSMNKTSIAKILSLQKSVLAEYTIALGYPAEKSKVEHMKKSHRYYKDGKDVMHVPKRQLSDILHHNQY